MIDNSLVIFEHGQNIVGKRTGGRSAPTTVNSSVRTREYLTTAEIERLMAAARKSSRYGHRDATMILIGYRHGLRASELFDLQWSQVELASGRLHVRRAKNGSPSVHPMQGDEIRALRHLQIEGVASRSWRGLKLALSGGAPADSGTVADSLFSIPGVPSRHSFRTSPEPPRRLVRASRMRAKSQESPHQ